MYWDQLSLDPQNSLNFIYWGWLQRHHFILLGSAGTPKFLQHKYRYRNGSRISWCKFRVVKTVFLSPTENRWFWRKMAKMTIYILPTKTRGCAPHSPETDEKDENGGCPSDKTRVYQKQSFRHPDKWVLHTLFPASHWGSTLRKYGDDRSGRCIAIPSDTKLLRK